jgi:Ca2+-transporting ATPase
MITRPVPTDRLTPDWPHSRGLAARDVAAIRGQYGFNDIVDAVEHSLWALVRDTAKDPMIWFFAATSVLYAIVGQRVEAATLLVAIVPVVVMDAFLHRRTQASTEGLQSRLASTATVIRDGERVDIAARDVVPGDLAVVAAGATVPADGIVVAGDDPQVDESSLTGESYPVRKRALAAASDRGVPPRVGHEHWAFAGTRLLTGRASVVIAYTGGDTLYGEIVRSARCTAPARTPLQNAIQHLVTALVVVAVVICAILVVVRLRQGHGWVDAIISAVTLATAALPEEFPVVFAFFLGVGVYRLARRGALVRRAVSVENIGRVSCICSDKTGTITEGMLRLAHVSPVEGQSEAHVLGVAMAASRQESGDPLDVAILSHADASAPPGSGERVATFPFTEDRKRETGVWRRPDGNLVAFTKGAAEVVLDLTTLSAAEREAWGNQVSTLGESGHKVIACAWRPLDQGWIAGEPSNGFTFAGLLAFEDPVRDGVSAAIATCQEAGIQIIMMTGDHPITAGAVAREIGLSGPDGSDVITGADMDGVIERGEPSALRRIHVIARAAPAQKLSLVRALQERGEIVAVTGDGVNDVPALQAADIGIAMGERGTRSAREVAAIVLLDDNFRTIVHAIAEGRQLFTNLQLSFQYVLLIHIPLVITAALIPLAGYPLLYLPVHIVWLEMLIHPTALLAFQAAAPARTGLVRATPSPRPRFFSPLQWTGIVVAGALVTVLVAAGYVRSYETGHVEHGRAMALAILTLSSASVTAALSRLGTAAARRIVAATIIVTITLTQVPPLARALGLAPLHLDDWAIAVTGSVVAGAAVWVWQAVGGTTGKPR